MTDSRWGGENLTEVNMERVNTEFRHTQSSQMLKMLAKLVPAANDNDGGDNERLYAQNKFYWPGPVYTK